MAMKEIKAMMLRAFPIIVTGIVAGMFFMGSILDPGLTISLQVLGQVLFTAAVAALFFLWFYAKQDLTRRQMALRLVGHFLTLTPSMLFLVCFWRWIPRGNPVFFLAATGVFFVIYCVIFCGVFLQDARTASQLNSALEKRRALHGQNRLKSEQE